MTLLISATRFDRSRFSDECWTKFKYDSARGTNALCLCEGGEVLGVVLKLRNALRDGGREFLMFSYRGGEESGSVLRNNF